jgi:hypothetical protein
MEVPLWKMTLVPAANLAMLNTLPIAVLAVIMPLRHWI